VMLDITERNQLMRQLDKATRTDPLTGAANRREFDLIIHDEYELQKNSNTPLSLMTLDLDFFKQINDRFGPGGGEQALQLITEWLQKPITINRQTISRRWRRILYSNARHRHTRRIQDS
jgi:diguanylate cyclase (GGDEF)-like protein